MGPGIRAIPCDCYERRGWREGEHMVDELLAFLFSEEQVCAMLA